MIMFRQTAYTRSVGRMEFQVNELFSLQRFLDMCLEENYFTTAWRFREALSKAELIKALFETFGSTLD